MASGSTNSGRPERTDWIAHTHAHATGVLPSFTDFVVVGWFPCSQVPVLLITMPKKKRGGASSRTEEEPDRIEIEIRTSSMAKAITEKAKAYLVEGFKQFKVAQMQLLFGDGRNRKLY